MKFSVFQASSQGGRDDNEDRLGYTYTHEAILLTLADGMGGYSGGEQAAEIAVRVFTQSFLAQARPRLAHPPAFLQQTLLQANRAIVDYARSNDLSEQPRTTLVAALLQDGQLWAVHAGDSRLYGLRAERVWFRTRDHSFQDKPELFQQPSRLANRNLLFTCLGSQSTPLFDHTGPLALQAGDQLLLCSDGLWSTQSDADLVAALQGRALRHSVPALVRQALHKAGPRSDNVSLLALQWGGDGAAATGPGVAQADLFEGSSISSFGQVVDLGPDAQPTPGEGDDVFDLERIEQSIDEINAAIRRTALRRNRP
ncbi:serine/threonine protein phosphatase [Serpentinimonas raichei]|uniref:Serine/threonine protein phosphatase n=1 Tax=Serpentinimonas raichei TaxID=1458425 RepID=A0A060NJ66_9BURK|nr:PP2C family serine/threonine-protein phosphatase [Serpentinimonas raichei]BAO81115.1 serine/threonine protein phosphatase [Serpentinimonas raichei]